MEIKTIESGTTKIAEVIANELIIQTAEDGLDLLGNLYYQGFDKIVLHSKNIAPEFFDLKTGIAGEVLQKFSNYRVQLAIVGDFSNVQSKSLRDFIFESNKTGHVRFVESTEKAVENFSGKN